MISKGIPELKFVKLPQKNDADDNTQKPLKPLWITHIAVQRCLSGFCIFQSS